MRILGIGLVMWGCILGILRWRKGRLAELSFLKEQIDFVIYAKARMTIEMCSITEILSGFCQSGMLHRHLNNLAMELEQHCYPSGEIAWSCYWKGKEAICPFGSHVETWQKVSLGLFGRNLEENERVLSACQRELEGIYEEERREFRRKDKIVTPVALTMAFLVVILLC